MALTLSEALAEFAPDLPLTVAFSGGADSSALLMACHLKWPGQVDAVHVHHGLQKAADQFEQHAREVCRKLGIALQVCRIDARHRSGQSPEDAARLARYGAFERMAQDRREHGRGMTVALAHHANDQVETMLLALSRGAGLPGLSAMGSRFERDGVIYHRPLLQVPQTEIRRWLAHQDMAFIEDPSNADQRYTRNRIRARLLPALEACFPGYLETFSRSAAHAAQAQTLLDELAVQDLAKVGVPPRIRDLRMLSGERQANLLRHWLKASHQVVPSAAQMQELLRQIQACDTRGHQLDIRVAHGRCRRVGAVLDWYNH